MNDRQLFDRPKRLHLVIDTLDQPIFLIDLSGYVTFANQACMPYRADWTDLRIMDLAAPEEAVEAQAFLDRNNGPAETCQLTLRMDTGTRIGSLTRLVDDRGVHAGFSCLIDTTAEARPLNIWETALDCAEQAVWDTCDEDGRNFVSDRWFSMRGFAPVDDPSAFVRKWRTRVHPDDQAVIDTMIDAHNMLGHDRITYQYRYQHHDGHWIWIASRGKVVRRDKDGMPTRVVGTDTDITDLKRIEHEHADLVRRLRITLESSGIGTWQFFLDGDVALWDQRMLQIFGLTDGRLERPKDEWTTLLHADDRERILNYAQDTADNRSDFSQDYRIIRGDGEVRHIRSFAKLVLDDHRGANYLGVCIDITDDVQKTEALEVARAAMEYESRHDALTGLANRRMLDEFHMEIVQSAVDANTRPSFTVMHIDLDHFKEVNDSLGHAAGDAALVHATQIIRKSIGDVGLVARVGGDEFVAILPGNLSKDALTAKGHEICLRASEPFPYKDEMVRIGTSIGVARHTAADPYANDAFVAADLALYQAKKDGRGCVRHFEQRMRDEAQARRITRNEIQAALDDTEFVCHYQPQFDAITRKVIGLEALVRWQSDKRGLLQPTAFLSSVEVAGLGQALDDFVFRRALADLKALEDMTGFAPNMSVNVSASRLLDKDLGRLLDQVAFPAGRVTFELIETTFLDEHQDTLARNLAAIRAKGAQIDINDFGSGHASILNFLKIMPDRIKIAPALIAPIVDNPADKDIVCAITDIAKMRGAKVVAEGIETAAHADIAQACGCDALQGFGLAKPMPLDELISFLANDPR